MSIAFGRKRHLADTAVLGAEPAHASWDAMTITNRGAGQRKNEQCPATRRTSLALIRMLRLNDVMFAK
jgi:hypothetical protein